MHEREEKDRPTGDNPVTAVRHQTHGTTGECLGLSVHLWCPGCQSLHAPVFRCEAHGGPPEMSVVWDGDPRSDPFTMSPSYLVHSHARRDGTNTPRCHSFIREGQWEFLGDCTHDLAGQTVPLEPLPDWLVD